jgi:hypothetical protein
MAGICISVVDPIFQPAMRNVIAITNANPASVTTSFPHNYVSNAIVRLNIPFALGMQQANRMLGTITVTGATTFTIDIDTTHFNPFAIPVDPSPLTNVCAYVVPVGEANKTFAAAVQNILP